MAERTAAGFLPAVLVAAVLLPSIAFGASLSQAEKLIAAGKWAEAEQALAQITAADPGNFKAHLLLGQARYKQGKLSLAAANLRMASHLRPDSVEAVQLLGYVRFAQDNYSDAIALLKSAIDRGGDNALTRYRLGLAYQRSGQHAKARVSFHAAALKYPKDVPILAALARLESRLGHTSEAAYWYRKAVALRPNDVSLFYEMTGALMAAENYLRAQVALKSYLAEHPNDAAGWRKLADVYEKLGLSLEAQAVYLKLEEMGALRAQERRALLEAYMRQGQWAEAARQYEKLSKQADADLHTVGGQVYANLGMWDQAIAALQKAVALAPTAKRCRLLADAYRAAGRYQEAYEAYGELLKTGADAGLLAAAADAALKSGQGEAALNLLKRLAATAPDDYELRTLVAEAAERARDLHEALAQWHVASELPEADDNESRLALARLGATAGYRTWALAQLQALVWAKMSAQQLVHAARLANALGDGQTAQQAAKSALAKQDAEPQWHAMAGELLMRTGTPEDLGGLESAWQKHSEDAELADVYARYLLQLRKYAKAIEVCRKGIVANPEQPDLYVTLIECCERYAHPQIATDLITAVLTCEGLNPVAADFLRIAYERSEGAERAAAEMLGLLRLHPESPALLATAGHALEKLEKWQEASELYERLIPERGTSAARDAAACYIKAGLLLRAKDVVAANLPAVAGAQPLADLGVSLPLDVAMRLLGAETDSVEFYLAAANIYAACNEADAGMGLFDQLVARDHAPQARAGKAYLLYRSGDYLAAVAELQQLPASDLADPQGGLLLAECYLGAGNFVAAMHTAQSVASDEPELDRRAAEIAAEAAERSGDAEGALAGFARLLLIAPGSAVAADGIEKLCSEKAVSLATVRHTLSEVYRYAQNPAAVLALGAKIAALPDYEDLQDWVQARRGAAGEGQ